MLPAYNISADIENINFVAGTVTATGNEFEGFYPTNKLASEEKMQFPVCAEIETSTSNFEVNVCALNLTLNYKLKIFNLIRWSYSKEYSVELRESSSGFDWHYTMK